MRDRQTLVSKFETETPASSIQPPKHKITRKRDLETNHERFLDFEIVPKFSHNVPQCSLLLPRRRLHLQKLHHRARRRQKLQSTSIRKHFRYELGKLAYSYFEKGCREKSTRQSRKLLWVILRSLFFKESQNRMAREAMDICLQVLKESNKSRFDSHKVRNSVLIISHITCRDCRVDIFSDNLSRNGCIQPVLCQGTVKQKLD